MSDLDAVAAMAGDADQMRFYPAVKGRAEVAEWIGWNLALYDEHGFGTWCIESPADSEFVGYCGLRPLVLGGQSEVELAWHVKKTYWNRGLATEAAAEAKRLAFDAYGLWRIVAIIHPDNRASRRVAEKLGMVEERAVVHDGQPAVVYTAAP